MSERSTSYERKGWQISAKFHPPASSEASDRKSATAALWAIAIALATIAALLALVVMMNAKG